MAKENIGSASNGDLLEEARRLAGRSQSPPAERAGAVALLSDGSRHPGVAIHVRGVPGLSACAAEVALCAARSANAAPITRIALWIPDAASDQPCGKCLQIWRELAPDAVFVMQRGDGEVQLLVLEDLLPNAFTHFDRLD